MRRATVGDGGFVVPGRCVTGRGCTLWLTESGATVSFGSTWALLPWADHRASLPSPPVPGAPGADVDEADRDPGWTISYLQAGQHGSNPGVAVRVCGLTIALVEPVRRASAGPGALGAVWRRVRKMTQGGPAVPLAAALWFTQDERDRDLMEALCLVLAQRPEARARLADQDRVERLLADLRTARLRRFYRGDGLRGITLDTIIALDALGYVHPVLGRPVAGDPIDAPDVVQQRVLDRLLGSPYHPDGVEERAVADTVRRMYLDIEPWPFAALTRV